jgi:hypothetical protein
LSFIRLPPLSPNCDGADHRITPLFVSVTAAVRLTDHDGSEPNGDDPYFLTDSLRAA